MKMNFPDTHLLFDCFGECKKQLCNNFQVTPFYNLLLVVSKGNKEGMHTHTR